MDSDQKNGRSGKGRDSNAKPAYFSRLSVANVLCFGDETQVLNLSNADGRPSAWTVLLGNNGTGKTTLLQCLSAFFSYHQRDPIDEELASHRFLMRWASRKWSPYREQHSKPSRIAAVLGSGGKLATAPAFDQVEGRFEFIGRSFTSDAVLGIDNAFAYGAGRRLSTGSMLSEHISDPAESLFSDDAVLRNAEEWLIQADYRALKLSRKGDKEQLDRIRDVLIAILPEIDDLRIVQPESKRRRAAVEFKTPYGWVPLKQISYGYKTLIAWMVDFASRMFESYPNSSDPLTESAVVLVDEIDLHLHPAWQRSLMSYLSERFPNTQFIVTAHSPLIVQAAPSVNANIAVLRREDDHVVIDNTKASVDGWRLDQILTSELFGLPSARAAEYDKALSRRVELLSKPTLSSSQKRELTSINKKLAHLPAGETAADAQDMLTLAKSTMELLKEQKGRRK
jgi:hypothetical protein